MNGKKAKALRRMSRALCHQGFTEGVDVKRTVRKAVIADSSTMEGYRIGDVVTDVRTHKRGTSRWNYGVLKAKYKGKGAK